MKIPDILAAARSAYSARYAYWLSFILAAECELASDGHILAENCQDGAGLTFAGLTQRDDDLPENPSASWIATTYRDSYWRRSYAESLPWGVGEEVANIAVNEGVGTSARILQQTLVDLGQEIAVDALIGASTLSAALAVDPDALLRALVVHNDTHYQEIAQIHPNDARFLRGWLNRDANALAAFESEAKTQGLS